MGTLQVCFRSTEVIQGDGVSGQKKWKWSRAELGHSATRVTENTEQLVQVLSAEKARMTVDGFALHRRVRFGTRLKNVKRSCSSTLPVKFQAHREAHNRDAPRFNSIRVGFCNARSGRVYRIRFHQPSASSDPFSNRH